MHLVSQLLAWVRALLFGPPQPGSTVRSAVPQPGPRPAASRPSPDVWGALLAGARRRRAPHLCPPTASADPDYVEPLVRAYVLPPQERARVLSATSGEVRW